MITIIQSLQDVATAPLSLELDDLGPERASVIFAIRDCKSGMLRTSTSILTWYHVSADIVEVVITQ